MGVPAFFRWLSRKYPSIVISCIEEKVGWGGGGAVCGIVESMSWAEKCPHSSLQRSST